MNSSTISSSALAQFPNLKRVFCNFASRMKMLKAVKKLKFWSRKKRKKKTQEQEPYYPYPPRPCHCCQYSSCYSSTQPSAPPLPPWLEPEHEQTTQHHHAIPAAAAPLVHQPSQFQFQLPPQEEIVLETTTTPLYHPTVPVPAATESNYSSYQQYMVPNPVYGMPVVQTPRRERRAGFFGCLVSFGIQLIRCFCPCFHIREVH